VSTSAAEIHEKIQAVKAAAEDLARAGAAIPAVVRNTARIRASIKMLEMGVCDVVELTGDG
jgi:hypothetical protein